MKKTLRTTRYLVITVCLLLAASYLPVSESILSSDTNYELSTCLSVAKWNNKKKFYDPVDIAEKIIYRYDYNENNAMYDYFLNLTDSYNLALNKCTLRICFSHLLQDNFGSFNASENLQFVDRSENKKSTPVPVDSKGTPDPDHSKDNLDPVVSKDDSVHSKDTSDTVGSKDNPDPVVSKDTPEPVESKGNTTTVESTTEPITQDPDHSKDNRGPVVSEGTDDSVHSEASIAIENHESTPHSNGSEISIASGNPDNNIIEGRFAKTKEILYRRYMGTSTPKVAPTKTGAPTGSREYSKLYNSYLIKHEQDPMLLMNLSSWCIAQTCLVDLERVGFNLWSGKENKALVEHKKKILDERPSFGVLYEKYRKQLENSESGKEKDLVTYCGEEACLAELGYVGFDSDDNGEESLNYLVKYQTNLRELFRYDFVKLFFNHLSLIFITDVPLMGPNDFCAYVMANKISIY